MPVPFLHRSGTVQFTVTVSFDSNTEVNSVFSADNRIIGFSKYNFTEKILPMMLSTVGAYLYGTFTNKSTGTMPRYWPTHFSIIGFCIHGVTFVLIYFVCFEVSTRLRKLFSKLVLRLYTRYFYRSDPFTLFILICMRKFGIRCLYCASSPEVARPGSLSKIIPYGTVCNMYGCGSKSGSTFFA